MTMPTEDTPTTTADRRGIERLGLTVEEAADLLGISRAFAYELVADGSLPCLRLRRRIVVPRAALMRMLDPDLPGDDDGSSDPAA
jgi:excisionase family DNA binding protein